MRPRQINPKKTRYALAINRRELVKITGTDDLRDPSFEGVVIWPYTNYAPNNRWRSCCFDMIEKKDFLRRGIDLSASMPRPKYAS